MALPNSQCTSTRLMISSILIWRYMCWLWLSSDFRLDPHKYCIPLQIHLLWGCNSKYPAASPKPSADFFWAWTGPTTFSDRLGQMQSLKELGQHRELLMRETQTSRGKYEHQVISPPADSLSISDVAEGKLVLTRAERPLSHGEALHSGS